jgi:hypothetical protein
MTWLRYESDNSRIQHYHHTHTFDCIIPMNITPFTDCDEVQSPKVTDRCLYFVFLFETATNVTKTDEANTEQQITNSNYKLYYQQLYLKYLCNLGRYWLQTPWRWHDTVETCRSVTFCEIIVHLLVIVKNTTTKKHSSFWHIFPYI